ncbi:CsgG/HfaB family protein [Acidobacteriota bacterium]
MNKKIGILLIILVFAVSLTPSLYAQSKLRVAVMDFENNSTWSYWGDYLGQAAADVFVTALMNTGQFSVIEREKIEGVLIEQDFGESGRVTPQTAAKIGKLLGVDLLLTGSISQFSVSRTGGGIGSISVGVTKGKVVLQARLVNTTSGEIIVATEEDNSKTLVGARFKSLNFKQNFDYGLANDIMHPAVQKMVVKIEKETAGLTSAAGSSGRVIKVEGTKVWINLGASSGIQLGDEFSVIRAGEELIDPDTGQSLGAEEEEVGSLVVTEVKDKYSIATIQNGNALAKDFLKKK